MRRLASFLPLAIAALAAWWLFGERPDAATVTKGLAAGLAVLVICGIVGFVSFLQSQAAGASAAGKAPLSLQSKIVLTIVVTLVLAFNAAVFYGVLTAKEKDPAQLASERASAVLGRDQRAIVDYQKHTAKRCLELGYPPPVGMTAERYCDAYGSLQAITFCREKKLQHTGLCS